MGWSDPYYNCKLFPPQTIDDYLAVDSDVPDIRKDMSTEQIVAAVQETVEVEPTEDDTEDPTVPPVSAKTALKAVETLRLFLLQQENFSTLVNGLDGYESQIQKIATNSITMPPPPPPPPPPFPPEKEIKSEAKRKETPKKEENKKKIK